MDSQTLGELIDEYAQPLELYARQWSDDAADLVQTAFLKLLEEPTFPSNVKPWLYRVVRNLAFSSLRSTVRRRNREMRHFEQSENWFEHGVDSELDGEKATTVLLELDSRTREVIVAHLWGTLTFEEIAELTHSSSSTVHRRYQNGIQQLRKKLGLSCPTTE
ncbi:RNA polymerase sigma factor SigV [Thalassoglobus neptunius]|uniref:RNA polymerase sigma factor SigV n=1 Tax=Thalassoglobus neptunius TaxID=1938619 RepID=A0A5C5X7S1_9PLAN|nr:RNA polymerase sigma factor [Thalassoglobus neptunius]TWT59096.1 RNA polymerase sigma factor SigV [Thalassoglobus neptunius]